MNKIPKLIVIDGTEPSAASALAKMLARHFGFERLDASLLLQGVARKVLDIGVPVGGDPGAYRAVAGAAARSLISIDMEVPGLDSDETIQAAAKIAALEEIGPALLAFQRSFAAHPPYNAPGAVLHGRDIGTAVCPDAPVKFFLADGGPATPADDACVLDANNLDGGQMFDKALEYIASKSPTGRANR